MKAADPIDTARLSLALTDLRLPAIKLVWPDFAARSDKEGWPAARFLAALAEHEMAERARRRIERHLDEARLPPGKTFDSFEFDAVPMISKAQIMALAAGDSWLEKGANLLLFGPPGAGKSHLGAALGLALVESGWRVLFTRTTDLVQRLQTARRDLQLEAAIARLDKYHLLILDDLAVARHDVGPTEPAIGNQITPLRGKCRGAGKPRRHGGRVLATALVGARTLQTLKASNLGIGKRLFPVPHRLGSRLPINPCIQRFISE